MNALFGSNFKTFHCFLSLMNRYCLQFRCHRLLELQNIFVLVAFLFHFQFRECRVIWRTYIWRVCRVARHWNPFFHPKLLLNCCGACHHTVVKDGNCDSSLSLVSHMQYAPANDPKLLSKILW